MPDAQHFLESFGLTENTIISDFIISSVSSTHDVIKRYQEYSYDIKLTFKNTGYGIYEYLYYAIVERISMEHVVYGVKNPYKCVIDELKYGDIIEDKGMYIFKLKGHSYRM